MIQIAEFPPRVPLRTKYPSSCPLQRSFISIFHFLKKLPHTLQPVPQEKYQVVVVRALSWNTQLHSCLLDKYIKHTYKAYVYVQQLRLWRQTYLSSNMASALPIKCKNLGKQLNPQFLDCSSVYGLKSKLQDCCEN